jgi:hypothetical protein
MAKFPLITTKKAAVQRTLTAEAEEMRPLFAWF